MFEMEDNEHFNDEVVDDEVSIGKIEASMTAHTDDNEQFQILKTHSKFLSPEPDIDNFNNHSNLVESQTPIVAIIDNVQISDLKMDKDLTNVLNAKVRNLEDKLLGQ